MGLRYFEKYINGLLGGGALYDFSDKSLAVSNHVSYMLDRTQSMFKYDGLPDTIPQRSLELYLQINGHCAFYEVNDNLYAFTGGLGGEPDAYYMPTIYTIANPALKLSVNAKIGTDCVVIPNDSLYIGLMPLYGKYATLLAENELTIKVALINSRIIDLIAASDDATKESAIKFLEDVENGKLGVIGDNAFLESLKTMPYGSRSTSDLTDLIEMEQYVKASWYNELGLNANYNMKRESLNSAESQLNDDALLPLIDDMLRMRAEGLDKVNAMFGTNIKVSLASAWEDNAQELEAEQKAIEEPIEEGGEEDGEKDLD